MFKTCLRYYRKLARAVCSQWIKENTQFPEQTNIFPFYFFFLSEVKDWYVQMVGVSFLADTDFINDMYL